MNYPWYAVVLCALVGTVYAVAMYAVGKSSYKRWVRWVLGVLRWLTVSVVCLLLLSPVMKHTTTERRLPTVVLVRDVSGSVAEGVDSAFAFDALADRLEGRCHVVCDSFGSKYSTDISEVLQRYRKADVSAMVMASDGIYNQGDNPATTAEGLPWPVHTVALGDTTPVCDAALTDLSVGRIASLGNRFPFEVTVAASLLDGRSAHLSVADGEGRTLFSQRVDYDGSDYAVSVNATLPATEAGLQRFVVSLSDGGGEATLANNVLAFYVDVIDVRRKVAIIANAPHPDIGAMKQAIESNPNYEAVVVLADDAERGKWKADAEEWDMVVLHNLPSATHPRVDYADGIPKMYVVGLQTDLPRFNALHCGLEIVSKTNKATEATALHRDGFGLFAVDAADAEIIEAMPPLDVPFGEARMSADVQILFSASVAGIDSRQPLVAATTHGMETDGVPQRTAYVWGEGLWRWRLADWQNNESFAHFDNLMGLLVNFTAMQQQRQRLQVEAQRSYQGGEAPVLKAQVYNESYELDNRTDVHLHLKGDTLEADYLFGRDGRAYSLMLHDLPGGVYRYEASTPDGLTDHGSFAVEDLNVEQRQVVADHALLRAVSAASGGQAVAASEAATLAASLAELKPVIYSHTGYTGMLRMPLVLLLIVLLLGAEWVLRKYHGEP